MISAAVLEALSIGSLPDVEWKQGDDLCDCTFQRIGMWKNPYLAQTREIRLCCVWEELGKQYPDLVRDVPGYWDENTESWITEPWEWNGETEMPKALWHRHLARKLDISIAEARDLNLPAPQGKPKREALPFVLLVDGSEVTIDLSRVRFRC